MSSTTDPQADRVPPDLQIPIEAAKPSGTRESDRIPVVQKLGCSMGYCVDYLAGGLTMGVLWMPVFNIGLGISPAILGVIVMILRVWDAITDTAMGNLSDNTRTRWGRRRPFMALGVILIACMYVLLWRIPAGIDPKVQAGLLLAAGMAFFAATTTWSVPFYSLRMELTPDYDERTNLSAWTAIAGKIVFLAGGWVLALVTCSWFADPVTGKPDIMHGMKTSSWGIASVILLLGLGATFLVKERYYVKVASRQPKARIWQGIRESFHCRPLWNMIGISFFMGIGGSVANTLSQYVSIYYVNEGRLADASILSGWRSTSIMIVGVLCIPLWLKLSKRFDKKSIVTVMLACSVLGHLLNLIFLTPENPYLMLIPAVFEMGAMGAVWLFTPSMIADVCDYDEYKTGRRREGSLNSFAGWFQKLSVTLGAGAGGFLVQMTGFQASVGEIQSHEVLMRMKWLYILLPVVLWSCSLLFIGFYTLSRKRMAEIRTALEARRGEL
jgi:glycoside/pentoside/hexuronide:cation symporter, GPH family